MHRGAAIRSNAVYCPDRSCGCSLIRGRPSSTRSKSCACFQPPTHRSRSFSRTVQRPCVAPLMHKLRVLWYLLVDALRRPLRTRADVEAWQKRRLRRFARRVLAKSAYYRPYVRGGEVDLSTVPVMTKDLYVEHFTSINTAGIDRDQAMQVALSAETSRDFSTSLKGMTVGLSTGTSGKRSLFVVSPRDRAQWAAHVVRRILLPHLRVPMRIAFFLRANSGLYESVRSMLFRFTYFDLTRPFAELLADAEKLQPQVLAAPPSILGRLIHEQRNGAVHLRPTVVVSFAEVLHDDIRHAIVDTYGVEPVNIYQCTEGFIGMTCAHGTMHLQEDVMHIEPEWVDSTHFRPVVTDFTRDAVPIVRYRMTDVLEVRATPCPCGSPMIAVERIVGRDDDVLLFRNERGEDVAVFPDVLSRMIARCTDDYTSYRIRQTSWTQVVLQVHCPEAVRHDVERAMSQAIIETCRTQGINSIAVTVEPYFDEPITVKDRRIQRLVHDSFHFPAQQ
ncbi:MAG: adenylate synthase [Candidatus Kapabacteria bacterium]|nr:adenylate synthase [Candidatus Kapabacteria bacterium]